MKTWVRRSINVGVLSAGFLLVGGTAHAADWDTGDNAGIATGNQLGSVLQVPVDVCGNSVAVLGFADASCEGGAEASNAGGAGESMTTGPNAGIGTGNQVSNVVQAPLSQCGNSVALLGFASAECEGGASADNSGGAGGESLTSGPNAGMLTGNQVTSVVQAPVSQCGNAVAALGFADASCEGGAEASNAGGAGGSMTTGPNAGMLTGNQISSIVQAPVSQCGNAVAQLGFASANCVGGAAANNGGDAGDDDGDGDGSGAYGASAGSAGATGVTGAAAKAANANNKSAKANNKSAKATKKTAKNGNENVRAHGTKLTNSKANAATGLSAADAGDCGHELSTGPNAGVGTGNQLVSVAQLPTDISGNAISLLGFASAESTGGASASNC